MSTQNQTEPVATLSNDPHFLSYLTSVEKDLLLHILTNMNERRLTVAQASQLAQEFLRILPMVDKEDLLKKLSELGGEFVPARETYAKFGGAYEEEKRQRLLSAMREHIKTGNIEQAIAVAKGGTHG